MLTTPGAPQYSYSDYWGTQVVAFNVDRPHHELSVLGISLVETQPAVDRSGRHLGRARRRRRPTRRVPRPEPLHPTRRASWRARAAELRRASPVATVEAVAQWVNASLEYVRGVTHVHTSAAEAFKEGRGVCQDFAHLALAVLRAGGVPARYVSGYLYPDEEAAVGAAAMAESHAWIEAWAGDWWGLDPTNGVGIGRRHVVVARGRDYADVPPVAGHLCRWGRAPHVSVRPHHPGPLMERLAVRIWLPDEPGMLAAVATRIASLRGTWSASRCWSARGASPWTSSRWSCPSLGWPRSCAASSARSRAPASRRCARSRPRPKSAGCR